MLYEYMLLNRPTSAERPSFEELMEELCNGQKVPGAVLVADGPGSFHYKKAFGTCVIDSKGSDEPLQVNTTFRLGSCTILMTTVAVLQCVERGLLHLDEDVTRILPELRNIDVLTSFDPKTGKPVLVKSRNTLTLRYLVSQSRVVPTPSIGRIRHNYRFPLIFEPGTSWAYGVGIDWAGLMVERVNGNMPLQQYMQVNIWAPLGITTATFHLDDRPDLKERLSGMARRQGLIHPIFGTTLSPASKIIYDRDSTAASGPTIIELSSPDGDDYSTYFSNDDFGGCGVYCSAPDFAKLLRSLCSTLPAPLPNPVLHTSTIKLMFTPQLVSGPAKAQLQKLARIPEVNNTFGGPSPHQHPPMDVDWGLGGMLVLDDVWDMDELEQSLPMTMDRGSTGLGFVHADGSASFGSHMARHTPQQPVGRRRSRGSMFWGSTANFYWWMDQEAGVSGVWASQLVPAGDPWTLRMMGRFETTVYEQVEVRDAGGVQAGEAQRKGQRSAENRAV